MKKKTELIRNKRTQPLWKFYKIFESDIWGTFLRNQNYKNKLYIKFRNSFRPKGKNKYYKSDQLWRVNIIEPKKKIKRKNLWWLTHLIALKLKIYYNNMHTKQIKKLCYKFRDDFKSKFHIFMLLLEVRLDTAIFRMHLVDTMHEARQFVIHKNVIVNGQIMNKLNFFLKKNDILSVKIDLRLHCFFRLLNKLKKKNWILYNHPIYFEINWRNLQCIFIDSSQTSFDTSYIPYLVDLNVTLAYEFYNI